MLCVKKIKFVTEYTFICPQEISSSSPALPQNLTNQPQPQRISVPTFLSTRT